MTDLEPVEPRPILLRNAGSVVRPARWTAARLNRSRMIVASGIRALTAGRLLPGSALAVAAFAAAKAAAKATGGGRNAGPVGHEAVGRILTPGRPGATVHVSWTHVEMRWRE